MEAGAGTLLRMSPGDVDVVLLVTEPTAKSVEASRRLAEIAAGRPRVVVVANKVRGEDDVELIREVLGTHEVAIVPYDAVVEDAERDGLAPIDLDEGSPAVRALALLADRLAGRS